jgi:hypothetical protein
MDLHPKKTQPNTLVLPPIGKISRVIRNPPLFNSNLRRELVSNKHKETTVLGSDDIQDSS